MQGDASWGGSGYKGTAATFIFKLAGDGAFSPKHTYSIAEVKSIVAYARDRGIAVLPELDMPGHSTSWQRGYPEISSKCSSGGGSHFTTPMDPTANATYKLIDTLLTELGFSLSLSLSLY